MVLAFSLLSNHVLPCTDRIRNTYVYQPTGPTTVLRCMLYDTTLLPRSASSITPHCWPVKGGRPFTGAAWPGALSHVADSEQQCSDAISRSHDTAYGTLLLSCDPSHDTSSNSHISVATTGNSSCTQLFETFTLDNKMAPIRKKSTNTNTSSAVMSCLLYSNASSSASEAFRPE